MILMMVILLILLILLGLPLFAGILAAAMIGLHVSGVEPAAIPIEIFRLANTPILLAIPLFTFAGENPEHNGGAGRNPNRLPPDPQSLSYPGGVHDGYIQRHPGGGPSHRPTGRQIRNRSGAPGHHFLGQPGNRLQYPPGGTESLYRKFPIR